jgi:O-antigen/teichoic acid export membrane protein
MAYTGFGVWSLVARSLSNRGLISIFLWIWNKWKPDLIFSKESFNNLFGFGSKLLASGLIGTLLNNLNYLIIAKYFSAQDLGYFTRAEMFKKLPSENVSSIITTVAYPVLATVQNDKILLKSYFRKMFTNTFFIIIILMVGLAAVSESLILTLIGDKWLPSVVLLQLLCFAGIMYPLNSMNINILNVVGRSDLYLKLQLIVQVLAIPNIFIGVFFGIKALIIGMNVIALVGYIIFNIESNKVIHYSIKEQIFDILPSFNMAIIMGGIVYIIGYFSDFSNLITLLIQIVSGGLFVIFIGEVLKIKEYIFIKKTLFDKIKSIT